jgi:CheY-like chemotaxis protein
VKGEILIVDDDRDIRETLGMILEDEGYCVGMAADGRAALEHMHAEGAPSVILLDLMMPGMNGWEFLEHKRVDPELAPVPVVVLSASSAADALPGPSARLRKPVDYDRLLSTIGALAGA